MKRSSGKILVVLLAIILVVVLLAPFLYQPVLNGAGKFLAAAEAPARPVPTTMIEYFRLFAALTSFRLKRWVFHFCSIGPDGIFASSVMAVIP